jgi:hypothetical protein
MKLELELPDYSREQGLHLERAGDAILSVRIDLGEVVIAGNASGLASFAHNLLTLSQPQVPTPYHFHLGEFEGLKEGSIELVVEKI